MAHALWEEWRKGRRAMCLVSSMPVLTYLWTEKKAGQRRCVFRRGWGLNMPALSMSQNIYPLLLVSPSLLFCGMLPPFTASETFKGNIELFLHFCKHFTPCRHDLAFLHTGLPVPLATWGHQHMALSAAPSSHNISWPPKASATHAVSPSTHCCAQYFSSIYALPPSLRTGQAGASVGIVAKQ